jgi:general stress protein 26
MSAEPTRREKLLETVKTFDTAMLVTKGGTGGLHARPMAIADVQDDGVLWFVTSSQTPKVWEIAEKSEVNIALQSSSLYASLTGQAQTVRNPAKIRELWKESWRVWFPDGPEQKDLVLISVEPTIGEFWDNRGTKGVQYLWEAAKAYVKGEKMDEQISPDQHGKVQL